MTEQLQIESDGAPNKQERKTARARKAICEAAIHCLAQYGYAETSINRVVEAAGVSKGALQYHFPSKEDLMADTAHYLLQRPLRYADRARSRAPRALRDSLRDQWKRMIDTEAYRALLEILVAARTDKLLQRRIAGELEASIRKIDADTLGAAGALTDAAQTQLARLLCVNRCFMRGLLIEQQYSISRAEQAAVLEAWLDLVCPAFQALVEAS
jgi:AcrR family transcriptional regulator